MPLARGLGAIALYQGAFVVKIRSPCAPSRRRSRTPDYGPQCHWVQAAEQAHPTPDLHPLQGCAQAVSRAPYRCTTVIKLRLMVAARMRRLESRKANTMQAAS